MLLGLLTWAGCTDASTKSVTTTTLPTSPVLPPFSTPTLSPQSNQSTAKILSIRNDYQSCLFDKETQKQHTFSCENLGEVALADNVKAVLLPKSPQDISKVSVQFFEKNKNLNIPGYFFDSFINENSEWFSIGIHYLDNKNIYLENMGGHERATSAYYYYDGQKWQELKLAEKIIQTLKDKHPDQKIEVMRTLATAISEKNIIVDIAVQEGYSNIPDYSITFDRQKLSVKDVKEF